jgi:hypothetical protein
MVFMEGEDLSWVDDAQLIALEVHEGSKTPFGASVSF